MLAASGQNSLTFRWVTWDLSEWAGMTAHVEIADESSGGWGIICCDQVVVSDAAATAADSFTLTFTRMKSATDIVYHVDASDTLATWAEIWNSSGVPYGGGAAPSEQVVVSDSIPVAAAPNGKRFMRLRVSQPQ